MKGFLLVTIVLIGAVSNAMDSKYYEIATVEESVEYVDAEFSDLLLLENAPARLSDTTDMIKIGVDIIKLILEGRPKVSTPAQYTSVLPSGDVKWNQIKDWKVPSQFMVKRYTFKNHYGQAVVDFQYKLIYYYGGSLNGHGAYLANVHFLPTVHKVMWMFNLDLTAEFMKPLNMGTKKDPVPMLPINVHWKVSSPIKHVEYSHDLEVSGHGEVTHQTGN